MSFRSKSVTMTLNGAMGVYCVISATSVSFSAHCVKVVEDTTGEFKRGRNNVEDEHRSGRPKDAASAENVQIVNGMLKEDRRRTIRHIVETTDIHVTTLYRLYRMIWTRRRYQHVGCLEC